MTGPVPLPDGGKAAMSQEPTQEAPQGRSRGATIGAVLVALAVAAVVPVLLNIVTPAGRPAPAGVEAPADPAQAAAATASRMAAADLVDVPVTFQVHNTNRSLAPCTTPDGTFEVAGHLTAPAALLATPGSPVTLYLHDFSTGEWYWRLDVDGYHHTEEMARRGLASVTIDRLGYGASDRVNGFHTCVGAQADVTDQIVQQLRTGAYTVEGRSAPAFGGVTLAGLGTGAQIAQLTTLFGHTQGLVVMGFSDMGRTDRFMTRVFGNLSTCMQQAGPDQQPTSDGGYSIFDVGATEYRQTNFHDADPVVLAAALPQQSPHPCKEVISQLEAITTDLQTLGTVTVPVLGVYGESDRLFQGGAEHLDLFASAASTELVTVPAAGHYMGLERSAPVLHDALAAWLSARETP
jgi:hypothetical protein